jgi:hypothetical protein
MAISEYFILFTFLKSSINRKFEHIEKIKIKSNLLDMIKLMHNLTYICRNLR